MDNENEQRLRQFLEGEKALKEYSDDTMDMMMDKEEEEDVGKAMNVGALSGEPGFTPIPEVVDGQVNQKELDERERKAQEKLKEFWEAKKREIERKLKNSGV